MKKSIYALLAVLFTANICWGMARDEKGFTDLHTAAIKGKVADVKRLLSEGADVNVKSNDDQTPLHGAAFFGETDTVKELLDKGADVHVKDIHGNTPLHSAARRHNADGVIRLLLAKGANKEAQNKKGEKPWQLAKSAGYQQQVNLLR